MSNKGFEVVDHTADWALRVFGRDLQELLTHAAQGMNSLMVSDIAAIPIDVKRKFKVEAIDSEGLLVDWLSELAYLAEIEQLVFRQHELTDVKETRFHAVVRGGHAPEMQKHIKAVTYHNLQIIETAYGLEATIVFDV